MASPVTIHLAKPVKSVKVLTREVPKDMREKPELEESAANVVQDLEVARTEFSQSCRVLEGLVAKLNEFYDRLFAESREQIARLSVEIARKILMQKVQNGDYEIEAIVKEALNNAPTRQDVVVHLNPEDLVACQKAGLAGSAGDLAGIKFVADPNIGKAECLLETPKGTIKSLIDEQLERVTCALQKVE